MEGWLKLYCVYFGVGGFRCIGIHVGRDAKFFVSTMGSALPNLGVPD